MKRKLISMIAFLLTLIMLIPILVGCGSETEGDESSVEESIESAVSEGDEVDLIPVENPQYSTNIAIGKSYINTADAGEKYPDSYGIELTDGKTGPEISDVYTEATYSGYHGNAVIAITVDLGDVHDKLYRFSLGYLGTRNAGLAPPSAVRLSVSSDGKSFDELGKFEIPEFVEGRRLEAVYESEHYISARFVRFTIIKNAWLFIDELTIISNEEESLTPNETFLEMIKSAYDELGTVEFEGGEAADNELTAQLVSSGCEYTVSAESVSTNKDDGKILTDGNITEVLENGKWVGFDGGNSFEVTIDLGKVRNDLSRFELNCYSNNVTGNYMPVAVTYSVSEDNKNFTEIGRVYGTASGQKVFGFPLILDNCASGRYVKFTVEKTDSKLILIEEAAVYANIGVDKDGSYSVPLHFDSETKEWENPSNKTVNLIAGVIQQTYIPADIVIPNPDNLSPGDIPVLTDGIKAVNVSYDNDIHNGKYYKFMSAAAPIEFYFDLGATSAVKSFTAQFTHKTAWGVQAPYEVTVYLSDDGTKWYVAGSVEIKSESEDCVIDIELKLKKAVKARFVCFGIMTCSWVGVSELEAFGTTSTKGAVSLADSGYKDRNEAVLGYLAPDEKLLNGISDLCLLYHGTKVNSYTVETLLPYLAYVDEEGKMQDTMFDSFLFLLSGPYASGSATTNPPLKSDLQWILDDIFTENENIFALDEAAGMVKAELKLPDDFKYGVTLALYQPESVNDLEDMIWYMDEFEKRLAECDFKNIELIGYYWFSEGVYPKNNESQLVNEVSKIVHARGFELFWIPWYCASGFDVWQNHGFDVACMQPGYVFKEEVPEGRLEQAAYWAKYYGMGIEIEISSKSFSNEALNNRYLEYLFAGAKYGFMTDCIHMYYQEIFVYYEASKSSDEKVRSLYDYTYQFIKGTLNANPKALEPISFECEKDKPFVDTLSAEANTSYRYEISSQPEHGTVSVGEDGSFIYMPEKGFTGDVSFTYIYNDGLGVSLDCVVEIEVK